MFVFAHPDDESFGCGGTVALYSRQGSPVTYVCATRGEMGRRMGTPPFTTREQLRHLRVQEMQAAAAALGISDLRFLDIWDKTVEFIDPDVLAERVKVIVEEVNPSLVVTFHPLYGKHPDHNAIGAATVRAVARIAPERRPKLYFGHARWAGVKLDLPLITLDISGVADVKLAAIRAHRSQSEGFLEQWEKQIAGDPEQQAQLREEWQQEMFWEYDFKTPIPGVIG